MKKTIGTIAGTIAATVLAAGTALAATTPAHAATTYTMRIKLTQVDGHGFKDGTFVGAARITTPQGRFLGYDGAAGSIRHGHLHIDEAMVFHGGVLYITSDGTQGDDHGTITGGSGRFAGATGTLTGHVVNGPKGIVVGTLVWTV